MKVLVFVLSVISLTMALPTVVDTPGLDHASAVALHMLFPQTATQVIEPYNDQNPTNTQSPGGEAHAGSNINGGYVPDNSSDGCTKAPDDIVTWNFLPACHRHDFGIRNYREQGRLNKATKRRIDDQFLEDLKHECNTHTITRRACKRVAEFYYDVVKRIDPDKDRV
ncbi:hypothetical protein INS49_011819 [Diaporthe citri]|uniref:uncharacterized protein n=1 Tax=Diaporthe citri TaxID=83186 RepID=UPI001C8035E1|nr:uncharacterized protein INS49_011819 [Diaporthe citri]KAG6360753.1 hypothetical protein INS49_011819 [Diaporthe citri]